MLHRDPGPVPAPPASRRPFHVAVIMDGNGRWATARGMPRTAGHVRGVESAKEIIRAAPDLGITHLTLFAFSTENWRRPRAEVSVLMMLLRSHLESEVRDLAARGVRLSFLGGRDRLPADIVALMERAEAETIANEGLHVAVAVDYGGRRDIVRAVQGLARQAAAGALAPEEIDEDCVAAALWTGSMPDPDLLIRTGGEKRISNFLLWQCAYAEFVFRDTLWPAFDRADLEHCIAQFGHRERRFGAVLTP